MTEWALRLSLATAFLSAVGDRLGAWGPHGLSNAARHCLRALLPVGRIQSLSIGDTRWCCRFVRNASCARLVAPTFTQYSADSRNLVGATPAGESPSRNIDVAIGHARQTRGELTCECLLQERRDTSVPQSYGN